MGFKGKPGLGVITGLDPVCPQCGPYEASEGIYPGHGQIKNWGWASGRAHSNLLRNVLIYRPNIFGGSPCELSG